MKLKSLILSITLLASFAGARAMENEQNNTSIDLAALIDYLKESNNLQLYMQCNQEIMSIMAQQGDQEEVPSQISVNMAQYPTIAKVLQLMQQQNQTVNNQNNQE